MPPNPLAKRMALPCAACRFATCKFPNLEKKFLPPPCQILGTPLKLLVHTLVMVRLDYCNVLLCGAREDVIRQLERLQRQAARVVYKKYKNDHTSVTELMWGLHWLPIRARIQYKILLLVYKAFTNGSATYLADMMTSCNPVRSTRSSHKVNLLVVPHQKSNKYSEKAFAVVGPRLWNELLTDELRGCNSVDTFKKKLKTMLFKKHY